MKKIRLATVFSGIGAIEFAFRRLNIPYEVIFACDTGEREIFYDKENEFLNIKSLKTALEKKEYVDRLYASHTRKTNFVKQSYLANYKIINDMFFEDICLLDGVDFKGQVDLFVGGSPCQSFSIVGSQGGLEDTRGTLFREFARLVNEIQPKVFIYENVKNMLKHDNGNTWNVIKSVFEKLDYEIDYKVLNSVNFNIPQNRSRLFVVGYKKTFGIKPKIIDSCDFIKSYTMQDFLVTHTGIGDFTFNLDGSLRVDHSRPENCPKDYILSDAVKKYVMSSGTKTWYSKPVIDLPIARTLLKTMGNCHRAGVDNYVTENGEIRMLTPRECLRLMGFTDDFRIVVSEAQTYKQAGNSIVVDVLMQLILMIYKQGVLKKD